MAWIKTFPWEKQKPKVDACLAYLKDAGAAAIGVMGFCYGGGKAIGAACVCLVPDCACSAPRAPRRGVPAQGTRTRPVAVPLAA